MSAIVDEESEMQLVMNRKARLISGDRPVNVAVAEDDGNGDRSYITHVIMTTGRRSGSIYCPAAQVDRKDINCL